MKASLPNIVNVEDAPETVAPPHGEPGEPPILALARAAGLAD